MKIGIIKERKNPPDRRVVLSPDACKQVEDKFTEAEIYIEPSDIRVFTDKEYEDSGLLVTNQMKDCQVLIGVKEVPITSLVPNKKYFFFSHTIKKQSYNRDLLCAVLQKNIELYDHEVLTNSNEQRVVAFGTYAGIVGAYNAFRTYGLKYGIFELCKAGESKDKQGLIKKLSQINSKLSNIKILLTGKGRVGNGAKEMLDAMGIKKVKVQEYLTQEFPVPVYCQIDVMDYNQRKDGTVTDTKDFFDNPENYKSNFSRFSAVSDLYIAGHFYGDGAPFLFTREDVRHKDFKIKVVADISCDINGPVATTIRSSTIAEPIYGYDPKSEKEIDFKKPNAIAVMAVDNLPCELPRDASIGFGKAFVQHVIPAFFNNDKDGILERARMTKDGKLTHRYSYLQDYIDGVE